MMVKNCVKIYARLKKEDPSQTISYDISNRGKHEDLTLRMRNNNFFINNKPSFHKFRFQKVFDQFSNQDEVFDKIAKPVVSSVMKGFNGTIFAYGQTGSGKTYTITGSPNNYCERGVIPRSIEEIFTTIKRDSGSYTVYISYLEIYNEVGYDLLNPAQKFSTIEDLPKIHLLDDGKSEPHLRNLISQQVTSEREAMRLLLLGDSNRTVSDTPMNLCSSRSHCIFTICITCKNLKSGKVRRSKLNLIDLAGSERVSKSNISGTTLTEAKHINLSLHYLEQVVLALTRSKTGHIPYRNSLLTYLLKDSLAGNCITILLATIAVNMRNVGESVATCKFAQRVANVDMEAVVNEETDPQAEIENMQRVIDDLRKELYKYSRALKRNSKLTLNEIEMCNKMVSDFLNDPEDDLKAFRYKDLQYLQFCFKILKQEIKQREEENERLRVIESTHNRDVEEYKKIIEEQEEEISYLTSLIKTNHDSPAPQNFLFQSGDDSTIDSPPNFQFEPPFKISPSQTRALKTFTKNGQNLHEVSLFQDCIEDARKEAKKLQGQIENCRANIIELRSHSADGVLRVRLANEQDKYKESLEELRKLKEEMEEMEKNLEVAKLKVMKKFGSYQGGVLSEMPVCLNYNSLSPDKRESVKSLGEVTSSSSFKLGHKFSITEETISDMFQSSTDMENVDPNTFKTLSPLASSKIQKLFGNLDYSNPNCAENTLTKESSSKDFLYSPSDSLQFIEFMRDVPLTGDGEVDEEIVKFYRAKFNDCGVL